MATTLVRALVLGIATGTLCVGCDGVIEPPTDTVAGNNATGSCSSDLDCDDGDPCTDDLCTEDGCLYVVTCE